MNSGGWPAALSIVAAASLFHVTLRRALRLLRRRLAVVVASPSAPAAVSAAQRVVDLAVAPVTAALWLLALWFAARQVPWLDEIRQCVVAFVHMSLTTPLFGMGEHRSSALELLEVPAILVALWLGSGLLVGLLGWRMSGASSEGDAGGIPDVAAFLLRGLVLFVGGIVVLQARGIDTSSFAFLASIVGVGLGFGMQNLANNFVSGVVIGLERPIRAGDYVQLGALCGTVERIGVRSTLLRTLDHVSILVPNSRFLEGEVVNWTHGDPVSRVHVAVGVAYGSNLARVRQALLTAASSHPDVLTTPRPRVEHHGFGESTVDFELLVWIRDPRSQNRLRSDLFYRIQQNLERAGIEIPVPQRDVHVKLPWLEAGSQACGRDSVGLSHDDDSGEEQLVDDDLGPASWSLERLESVAGRLRDGIDVRDRRYLLDTHARCFVGRDAAAWLRLHEGLTAEEALVVGRRLMEAGIFHHVLDEHPFRDGNFFYRFYADEAVQGSPSSVSAAAPA